VAPALSGAAGTFKDTGLRAALFALPRTSTRRTPSRLSSTRRQPTTGDVTSRPTTQLRREDAPLTEEFLRRKVPELLEANGLPPGRPGRGYCASIARSRRQRVRIREICRERAVPLWRVLSCGCPTLLRSRLRGRRTYSTTARRSITRRTSVSTWRRCGAASCQREHGAGRVRRPLGIYGNTVISITARTLLALRPLSEIAVSTGARVARGDLSARRATRARRRDHLHSAS